MFRRAAGTGTEAAAPAARTCRCEATTPASVLDGFACGRSDCWRTPVVQASFDRFVAALLRRREAQPNSRSRPE